MDKSTRRQVLRLGGVSMACGLAGCIGVLSGDDEEDEIKDTDGDGVIDSEDYAPRDASVQRADQVEESNSGGTSTEQPTEEPTEEPTGSIRYNWESGNRFGWRMSNPVYDGYTANFDITSANSISGSYSAQTEALNNRFGLYNPELPQRLNGDTVSAVSVKLRLDGDVGDPDHHPRNHNSLNFLDSNGDLAGRILFYHGDRQLRWSVDGNPAKNSNPRVLQSFSPGEVYDVTIRTENNSFTAVVNGEEYTDLPPGDGSPSDMNDVRIDCRNSTGVGPSVYNGPVYFTLDDMIISI